MPVDRAGTRAAWQDRRLTWPLRILLGLAFIAAVGMMQAGYLSPRDVLADLEHAFPVMRGVLSRENADIRFDVRKSPSGPVLLARLSGRWREQSGSFTLWGEPPPGGNDALSLWQSGRHIAFSDLPFDAWPVPGNPDWLEDPNRSGEWRARYHSLAWLRTPADEYVAEGDERYAEEVETYVLDWIADNPLAGPASDEAWFGEVVAARADTLIYLYDQLLARRFGDHDTARFIASVFDHGTQLRTDLDDASSMDTERALRQSVALYQISRRFPQLTGAAEWRQHARETISAQLTMRSDRRQATLYVQIDEYLAQFGGDGFVDPAEIAALERIGARIAALPLENGGFESTAASSADRDGAPIDGWPACSGPTRATTDKPHSGQYAMRLEGDRTLRGCAAEPVEVLPGNEYRVSVWARGYSGNDPAAGGSVELVWLDGDLQLLGADDSESIVVGTNFAWTRFQGTFTAPQDAAYVRAVLGVSAATPPRSFVFYDNLEIRESVIDD